MQTKPVCATIFICLSCSSVLHLELGKLLYKILLIHYLLVFSLVPTHHPSVAPRFKPCTSWMTTSGFYITSVDTRAVTFSKPREAHPLFRFKTKSCSSVAQSTALNRTEGSCVCKQCCVVRCDAVLSLYTGAVDLGEREGVPGESGVSEGVVVLYTSFQG